MSEEVKDKIINIRVSQRFKQRIIEAIRDIPEYSISRVMIEGAERVLESLEKNKDGEER